jgi:anti-sigma regulatory factor (Ser/Thr protein kinase)
LHEGSQPMPTVITVRSDRAEWPRLRAFAEQFADAHALAAVERGRLLIVLEELLTNLAKYGYVAASPLGQAEVSLALEEGNLVIVFADDGRAFNPLDHAVRGLEGTVEARPVGGLGIHLLRAFANEARYAREGERNRLTLVRRLGPRRDTGPVPKA